VKFQSAYFEKYLWEGVKAYYSLIDEAKALDLLVIGDVKRGDIGATSARVRVGAHWPTPPTRMTTPTRPTRSRSIPCSASTRSSRS
jgi:hypothetical protein